MKNLPTSILSSAELNTIAGRIVDVSLKALAGNPYVVTICTLIGKSNSDLSKSLGRTLISDFTSQLFIKDQARDHAFIGFRDFISALTHSNNEGKKAAAIILASIFETVGNTIYALGYAVETSKMNSLILNLKTPGAQQAIETIGACDWFEQLCTTQEAFENLNKTKTEANAAIDYLKVRDSRVIIAKYLQALLNFIGTNSDLDDAKYQPVKDKINVLITNAVTIARARSTRKANTDEEKDPPTV